VQLLATLAFFCGVIAYSVASTLFFLELLRPSDSRRDLGPRALGVGAGFHAAHVVSASLLSDTCPVESLHFALSFSALVAAGVYLLWRKRLRLDALGVLIAPLCLAFLVGAEFVGSANTATSEVPRALLVFHITANVLGTGLFLLAGTAGAFYVFEERRLKQKKLGVASRLPSLASLDRAAHRLLLAGFPLLTFGVVTGSMFLDRLGAVDGPELLRSVLGYASWLLLALVLALRRVRGWSGRSAAYGTLAGVGGVLIVVLFYVFRVAAS
jgi:ABC-type uncharacterized transport system permease subunit